MGTKVKQFFGRLKFLFTGNVRSLENLFRLGKNYSSMKSTSKPMSKIPTVWNAIRAIVENVTQAEVAFMEVVQKGKAGKRVYPTELIELFEEPNSNQTGDEFLEQLVGHLSHDDEVYIIKKFARKSTEAKAGLVLPEELVVRKKSDIQKIVVENRIVGYKDSFEEIEYELWEVMQIKGFNPYSYYEGLSVNVPLDSILATELSAIDYNYFFFKNGASPGVVLETDEELEEDDARRLTKLFDSKYKGENRAKTTLLHSGIKMVDKGFNNKDMDFVELFKKFDEYILGGYRVPKALFNITENQNYATFMGQKKIFWQEKLHPLLKKIARKLNKEIVKPYTRGKAKLYFDLSNVAAFQEDFKLLAQVVTQLTKSGFTRNEINERLSLGFADQPWGDHFWVNSSLVTAESQLEMIENGDNLEETKGDNEGQGELVKGDTGKEEEIKEGTKEKSITKKELKNLFYEYRRNSLDTLDREETIDLTNMKNELKQLTGSSKSSLIPTALAIKLKREFDLTDDIEVKKKAVKKVFNELNRKIDKIIKEVI